ncbi:olfactory receptor 4F3/4F16/4F29-like [Sturnira hondurensis]|uniref:olfactory receptor 4F3/4F16/4F29-like n=1 Tax=Sturnira hondurensis TaxID=192404 RepID=UPI0018793347|nr:olfactory receptor 4F3/4F16/4F29-like [Sturnira hondurensis]
MEGGNHSAVSEFVLLGLTHSWEIQLVLLVFSSVLYVASMTGNILIMFSVTTDPHLHTPMYFLLANLSFIDLGVCSTGCPRMIYDLFRQHKIISFGGCIAQIFFIHFLGVTEMILLIAMAIDRYVAICKPLNYLTIMTSRKCILFTAAAWAFGFSYSLFQLTLIVNLPFCGPNIVDSFYCDLPRLLRLACTDTSRLQFIVFANNGVISVVSFFALLIGYIVILFTVWKHSSGGSHKALSTLSAHITVVLLVFVPIMFIYTSPHPNSQMDKFLALSDAVLTPFLNPVIYTFRNKEMKTAIKRSFRRLVIFRKIS